MKVSDLAKEYRTTSEAILEVLKSLKLKAKDSEQELSSVVVSVLKSHLKNRNIPKTPGAEDGKEPLDKKKSKPKKITKKKEKDEGAVLKPKKVAKIKTSVVKEVSEVKQEKDSPKKAEELKDKKEIVEPIIIHEEKAPLDVHKIEDEEKNKDKKPKSKFSKEPLITLKPLQRKKRRFGSWQQLLPAI